MKGCTNVQALEIYKSVHQAIFCKKMQVAMGKDLGKSRLKKKKSYILNGDKRWGGLYGCIFKSVLTPGDCPD